MKPLTLNVADLGKLGCIRDVDPLSLPIQALSRADNVVCADGSITRLPVLRRMGTADINPAHCLAHATMASISSYEFIIVGKDFRIIRWQQQGNQGGAGFATDLTPTTIETYDYPGGVTSTRLNNVIFINRPDQPLVAMQVGAERFAPVSGWDIRRCNAIRSLNGMLVMIGITHKDGRTYPTAVANSDFTVYNMIPAADAFDASTTNSANETTLADLGSRLIDGQALGSEMFLYGRDETILMEPASGPFPFSFRKVFDHGIINTNCAVTKNNENYVFGDTTIWQHDRQGQKMILDGRNRNYLFKYLVRRKSHLCFVVTKPGDDLIYFAFPSAEPNIKFPLGDRNACNRAIVYNTRSDTWTFADLPYHVHGCIGSTDAGVRYVDEEANGDAYTVFEANRKTYEDLSAQSRDLYLWVGPGAETTDPTPDPVVLPPVAVDNTFDPRLVDFALNSVTVTAAEVLGNDSDPAGLAIEVISVAHDSNGDPVFDALTGTITLTNVDYTVPTSFTYTIRNAANLTASAVVTITWQNSNPVDPPVDPGDTCVLHAVDDTITLDPPASGTSYVTILSSMFMANDFDSCLGPVKKFNFEGLPTANTVTNISVGQPTSGTGTVVAYPTSIEINNPVTTAPITFPYTITIAEGRSATANITVNWNVVTPPPAQTAHRYWRVKWLTQGGARPDNGLVICGIAELKFNGSTPTSGQGAFASTEYFTGEFGPTKAFDGNTDTFWSGDQGGQTTDYIGWRFDTDLNVTSITMTAGNNSNRALYAPTSFVVQFSDPNTEEWSDYWTGSKTSWAPGETATFTKP